MSEKKYKVKISKNNSEWYEFLDKYNALSLFNSWGWGEYKKGKGWKVERLLIEDLLSTVVIGAVQVQIKKMLLGRVILVQSGPVARHVTEKNIIIIIESIFNYFDLGMSDIVIVNNPINEDSFELAFLSLGFSPVLNSQMYSFNIKLQKTADEIKKCMSRNWRHNLKRAIDKHKLTFEYIDLYDHRVRAMEKIVVMYNKTAIRKSFDKAIDAELIKDIVAKDNSYIIVEIKQGNEVVASRIGFAGSKYMLDFLAASNENSTKNYANYLALWALIEKAISLELDLFECGGIDPYGNQGVYNFKKGLSGALTTVGPLWVYSKSKILKKIILIKYLFAC